MNTKAQIQAMKKLITGHQSTARPILNTVRFTPDHIYCTDLQNMLIIEHIIDNENFNACIDFANIEKILLDVKRLERDGKTAILKKAKTAFKFPAFDAGDFPAVPTIDGELIFAFDASDLSTLERVAKFACNEKNRYELNSLLIENENVVATNQVYLRRELLNSIQFNQDDFKTVLQLKAIEILKTLKPTGNIEVKKVGDNAVAFVTNEGTLITTLVDAQFPSYQKALEAYQPHDAMFKVNISKEEINEALNDFDCVICENAHNATINSQGIISIKTPRGNCDYALPVYTIKDDFQDFGLSLPILKYYSKILNKNEHIDFESYGARKPILFKDTNGILFVSPCSA